MIGYCGIDCTVCPSFKDGSCEGCKTKVHIETCDCPILACAKEKGMEYCSECEEFPCEKNEGVAI